MSKVASIANIRLIALDLDGTTLTSERQIHPRNLAAVARATRAGIMVVLASGRIRPSMAPFAHQLELGDGPLICSNGAHLVGSDGTTLAAYHLRSAEQEAIIDFALREGLHVNGYTTDQMFYLQESRWLDLYRTRAKTIPTELTDVQALRAMNLIKLMIIAEPTTIRGIATRGSEMFDLGHVSLTESEPEYLEFLPRRCNKGSALRHLAQALEIDRGSVMAVGDYLNDVEMVAWAGHGVAMGNAVDEVKAVARQIVATNDEGGVSDAIEPFLH